MTAIEIAALSGRPGWLPALIGFLAGGAFLRVADQFLPHLHPFLPREQAEGASTAWHRATLLVLAITLHNIPEGLAVGVAFGAAALQLDVVVGATQPVIAPVGEERSNVSVFAALGRAMGFEDPIFHWSEPELRKRVVAAIELNGKPVSPAPFETGGMEPYDFDGSSNPVQFQTVLPQTEDGKIHLTPATLGPAPYTYDEIRSKSFPLCLITPASSKLVSSTFGEFNVRELHLSLHPEDARARGIESGDRVRVWNDLGEVECLARVDARVREGVVSLPKGAWMKSSLNGRTSTALTPTNVNVVGGGACFNDARVEVAALR